jgi:hypothetical protein
MESRRKWRTVSCLREICAQPAIGHDLLKQFFKTGQPCSGCLVVIGKKGGSFKGFPN